MTSPFLSIPQVTYAETNVSVSQLDLQYKSHMFVSCKTVLSPGQMELKVKASLLISHILARKKQVAKRPF